MGRKQTGLTSNPELAARAKTRRLELGLTVNEVTELLGVSRSRLAQMETDGVEGLSTIRKWADVLGLNAQDLAFGTPELDAAAGIAPKKKARRS